MKFRSMEFICLIVGIVIFGIGVAINIRYERAIDAGYSVTAMVTEVKYRVDYADEAGPDSDEYIAYGTYTVDGKSYHDVRLGRYSSEVNEGDTITLVVDPQNPAKKLSDGGLLEVPGFIIILISIVFFVAPKKKKNNPG